MSSKNIAQCCCGALKAETAGEPELVAACCCRECQRRTGSVLSVSGSWTRDKVKVTGPARHFRRKGRSGGNVELVFCPNCGSTVYWLLHDLKPEWVAIAAGAFADANFPCPSVSVWEANKAGWLWIPAAVHLDGQPQRV